jgi:hypothetical protein
MKMFIVSFWPCTVYWIRSHVALVRPESEPSALYNVNWTTQDPTRTLIAAGGCEENMFEAQKKPGVPDPKPLSSDHKTH